MNPRFASCVALLSLCLSSPGAERKAWTSLFDGQSLKGWVQRGGTAQYTIEDGAIVGTTVPKTPNSFLCTERDYGDFVLELEFQVDPEMNSGIQIRSHSRPEYKKGQVHGYQVEIDPSDRGWAGGIYEEGRRGWLYPLTRQPRARYAFRQNQWNHYRVEAIGSSIRTWVNGIPAADLLDTTELSGFIALQVHGVGNRTEPMQVRWRNIRIQDLGTSTWKPLWNGKNLDGWNALPGGSWSVKDGAIHGTSTQDEKRHGMLLSKESYGDFTARVTYKAVQGNSGFYFRAEPVKSGVSVHGFQAEIDPVKDAGGLYETGGRAWVVQPPADFVAKYFKPGDWNTMTVAAMGPNITVQVNDTRTAVLENDPGRLKGHFGLQLHGGQDMDVSFSQVEILVSQATPSPVFRPLPTKGGTLVAEGAEIRKVADGFKFTEGPAVGPDGRLYFSDIPNERIMVYDEAKDRVEVFREESGRANGLMWTPAGALLACEGGARRLTRMENGNLQVLAETFQPTGAKNPQKLNSPNDVVLDGQGGIYFTDPRYGNRDDMEMDKEAIYYLPRNGKLRRVQDTLVRPNGLILSNDGSILYVADNGAQTIVAFPVLPNGDLGPVQPFATMDTTQRGGGDGMTIDEQGNVYCAGQGAIWIWNPKGELVRKIPTPEGPANCTFGGQDRKTLYITARTSLYALRMNVAGSR